jgi:hypothetical protein
MMMYDPEKITFFAKTDARGQEIPFGIKAKDRQRHMYVVGKTGMGKSTLLENMAAQDIKNGEGIAFIDPHGSAAETLLEYVPEHRVKDVVYFAPFDIDNPVSFNVMEDVGPDKRHLVVSGLMSTFKKIWVDAWSARMEYILTNALLVLIEYPDTTLLSVNRLFIDKNYRKQVVDHCQDPAVKSFWTEEFASYTDRFAAEALPAIQNKIGQFTGNPLIRNIIGQPKSSFDIREIMDNKKILIMNLSKGLIGETNANLLGSMLTTRIYLAAMSRANLPLEEMRQMPNFYFYVDEFQSFANATFANILSEARKYHLNLIIAHQYIAQMEEEVRDAVFGNVGTTVSFRVGPFDGEVLETVFAPRFEATDLVNLGFAQIYLTLMIDGIGSQPFSAITLPPIQRPPVSCKEMVIASSRKNFAGQRAVVEKLVDELHTPKKPEPSPNNRPSQPAGGSFNKPTGGKTAPNPNYKGNNPHNAAASPHTSAPPNAQTSAPETAPRSVPSNPPQNPTTPAPQSVVVSTPTHSFSTSPSPNGTNNRPLPRHPADRPPRPPHQEKSPDDLRAILSKMTDSNQPKKDVVPAQTAKAIPAVPPTTVPREPQTTNSNRPPQPRPQPQAQSQPQAKPQSQPQAPTTNPNRPPQPQVQRTQTPPQNNLRPQPTPTQPAQPTPPPRKPTPQDHGNQDNRVNQGLPKPSVGDLKSALAEALKQVQQTPSPKITEVPVPVPVPVPAQSQPLANQVFSLRRTGLDNHPQPEKPRLQSSVVSKTPALPQAPATPAPAPVAKSAPPQSDSIDPQVIKKMLRHNDQERTPFQ